MPTPDIGAKKVGVRGLSRHKTCILDCKLWGIHRYLNRRDPLSGRIRKKERTITQEAETGRQQGTPGAPTNAEHGRRCGRESDTARELWACEQCTTGTKTSSHCSQHWRNPSHREERSHNVNGFCGTDGMFWLKLCCSWGLFSLKGILLILGYFSLVSLYFR